MELRKAVDLLAMAPTYGWGEEMKEALRIVVNFAILSIAMEDMDMLEIGGEG